MHFPRRHSPTRLRAFCTPVAAPESSRPRISVAGHCQRRSRQPSHSSQSLFNRIAGSVCGSHGHTAWRRVLGQPPSRLRSSDLPTSAVVLVAATDGTCDAQSPGLGQHHRERSRFALVGVGVGLGMPAARIPGPPLCPQAPSTFTDAQTETITSSVPRRLRGAAGTRRHRGRPPTI